MQGTLWCKPSDMSTTKMDREAKKELAKMYYLRGLTVQKELAAKVGVTEKTIGKWIKDEKWDDLKLNIPMVKQEQLQKLLRELAALNQSIEDREEGQRFATSKEADVRRKLVADIKDLEEDASVADTISVAMAFTKWVSQDDLELSRRLSDLFDSFIKDKL